MPPQSNVFSAADAVGAALAAGFAAPSPVTAAPVPVALAAGSALAAVLTVVVAAVGAEVAVAAAAVAAAAVAGPPVAASPARGPVPARSVADSVPQANAVAASNAPHSQDEEVLIARSLLKVSTRGKGRYAPARVPPPKLEPVRPAPAPPDAPRLVFRRGSRHPRAIAWFGFRSFWGHLWHLAASVIATEDIDARDWMQPNDTGELTRTVARLLGGASAGTGSDGAAGDGAALTERLERDLWIDFIADCGDDSELSLAVADMLFREYRVPDPHTEGRELVLPRGDVLLFGGDTAYPVATQLEIHNRVCAPFNRILNERKDGRLRVLLGIPGNHDWYDGLDGFARMFRAPRGQIDRHSVVAGDDRVDRTGQIGHFFEWVEAFRVGTRVAKRAALPLHGYLPVQSASYFALRVAPGLDLWAVDRQLREVDFAQRSHFARERAAEPTRGLIVVVADPVYAMLEPNPVGFATMDALALELEEDAPLVLTGDTHHYCRQRLGGATHVVAGGGGAFLHPAKIWRKEGAAHAPEAEFPGPRASFGLAMQVPWQIAWGRAGYMVHVGLGALYLSLAGFEAAGGSAVQGAMGAGLVAASVAALLGASHRTAGGSYRGLAIAALAAVYGAWVTILPLAMRLLVRAASWQSFTPSVEDTLACLAAVLPAALGFGTFLMVLTLLGLEQNQAFSSLAHPGYKHFVRLRIQRDGSAVDGWVLGRVDPLRPDEKTVLVDQFRWANPQRLRQDGPHEPGRAHREEA